MSLASGGYWVRSVAERPPHSRAVVAADAVGLRRTREYDVTVLQTRGRTKCFDLVWHVVFMALCSLHKNDQTSCFRLSVCLSVP
jgi:hypothetical protein